MNNIRSLFERDFVDFSLELDSVEKWVAKDLGFAVVYNGDRLTRNLTPNFSNTITNVTGRRGSVYWGASYDATPISFKIASDEATEEDLTNLQILLMPGIIKKLRLFETAGYALADDEDESVASRIRTSGMDRYAYVVLNAQPQFSFMPFDGGNGTILYRGDLTVTFSMLDGVWYGSTLECKATNITNHTLFDNKGSLPALVSCNLKVSFAQSGGYSTEEEWQNYGKFSLPDNNNLVNIKIGSTISPIITFNKLPRLIRNLNTCLNIINQYASDETADGDSITDLKAFRNQLREEIDHKEVRNSAITLSNNLQPNKLYTALDLKQDILREFGFISDIGTPAVPTLTLPALTFVIDGMKKEGSITIPRKYVTRITTSSTSTFTIVDRTDANSDVFPVTESLTEALNNQYPVVPASIKNFEFTLGTRTTIDAINGFIKILEVYM